MNAEIDSRFVEYCDHIFASAFAAVESVTPEEDRYLLLADLLGDPAQELVCAEANQRKDALIARAAPTEPTLRQMIARIAPRLGDLFAETTYTVASYWSPLARNAHRPRRSIFRRTRLKKGDAKPLAAAVLFYASTFLGVRPSSTRPMTSIIQYMSERADYKPSFCICFEAEEEGGTDRIFPIPPAAYSLWDKSKTAALVEELAAARSEEELDSELFALLSGERERSNETLEVVGRLRVACDQVFETLSQTDLDYLSRLSAFSNELFHSSNPGPIDSRQALIFVITTQLWRIAASLETRQMYVFPTAVGSTCCALTIGTRDALSSEQRLQFAHVAQSAFVQPLLLDYRTNEVRHIQNRNNNAFRRILGHNLPKILIQPGMNELIKMTRAVERLPAQQGGALAPSLRNLRLIFEHYEGFLTSVMCSNQLEEQFNRPPMPFKLDAEVWDYVRLVFELQRESLVGKVLPSLMRLEMDVPADLELNGRKEFLREVLFIILTNAVEALPPPLVKREPERAVLKLKAEVIGADDSQAMLAIQISDFAGGFRPDKLAAFRKAQATIQSADRATFWTTVSEIIEQSLTNASEGHLGIGLIFCLAYLRSLEWASPILKPGKLKIESEEGRGTIVTLQVPGLKI